MRRSAGDPSADQTALNLIRTKAPFIAGFRRNGAPWSDAGCRTPFLLVDQSVFPAFDIGTADKDNGTAGFPQSGPFLPRHAPGGAVQTGGEIQLTERSRIGKRFSDPVSGDPRIFRVENRNACSRIAGVDLIMKD